MESTTRIVTIQNKKGLHARAAAKFVKVVAAFEASVRVTRLGVAPASVGDDTLEWSVSGHSILGLMMLGAEPGVELELTAEGTQALELLDALEQLIKRRFDEEE